MKFHWYRDTNVGDTLTPIFFRSLGQKVTYANIKEAELIGIGSILQSSTTSGIIWTSGIIKESLQVILPNAKVVAVRGKETLARITPPPKGKVLLGDGGLITSYLFPNKEPKKYLLGIIPHYVDYAWVKEKINLIQRDDIILINVRRPLPEVLKQIQACQNIISSSLHGLIFADSYNIPNMRFLVPTSEKIVGGDFKFRDYYSVFEIEARKKNLTEETTLEEILSWFEGYQRPGINQIKIDLMKSFLQFLVQPEHS